jgi:hypothetical protein
MEKLSEKIMMKDIKKEAKQSSLIHQRIRNASFVPLESQDTEKFKYKLRFRMRKYINEKLIALKRICNKIIQKPRLWTQEIDFNAIKKDTAIWLVEALIEGFIVNFSVWALIGWRFTFLTMLGWGFAVKQLLSLYWRLKKDGSTTTLPTKDK